MCTVYTKDTNKVCMCVQWTMYLSCNVCTKFLLQSGARGSIQWKVCFAITQLQLPPSWPATTTQWPLSWLSTLAMCPSVQPTTDHDQSSMAMTIRRSLNLHLSWDNPLFWVPGINMHLFPFESGPSKFLKSTTFLNSSQRMLRTWMHAETRTHANTHAHTNL